MKLGTDILLILMIISVVASVVLTQPVLFFIAGGLVVLWVIAIFVKLVFRRKQNVSEPPRG